MKKSQIRNELKFHGNVIGGFALNFKSKENHNVALETVQKFAKDNQIKDYGFLLITVLTKLVKAKCLFISKIIL